MRKTTSIEMGALALAFTSACVAPPQDGTTTVSTGIGTITVGEGSGSGESAGDGEAGGSAGEGEGEASAGEEGPSSQTGAEGPKFDLGDTPETTGAADEGGCDTECMCTIPEHVPCDMGTADPFLAIGLNCPGELQVQSSTYGAGGAIGVRSGFGNTATWAPIEGSVFAVIGSGLVADLTSATPAFDSNAFPTHCNDDVGAFDPGGTLPAPLVPSDVGGDCIGNPALVGTGDCSNSIEAQFTQGDSAEDYTELRFDLQVPPDVISFSYDFAFFSVEYPFYYGSQFNDMYVGWLESELWTGNVSFDAQGNPISLNAGFLDYKDDGGNLAEFAGTCMRQHAGTGWLTTTAGVSPGEQITVVFAIFDLSDSILDSYAFIDNFQWGCDPTGEPTTEPEG